MKEMLATGAKALGLMKAYPISLYGGFKNRRLFEDIETYCMFIGHPRSGKSLTASLLDAHPAVMMSDDLGALKYVHAGFSKRQIYYLLLESSRSFAKAGCTVSQGYSYKVPNQWQGEFRKLQVIGDSPGEGVALRLRARPWLLRLLRITVNDSKRFIHVIRNPYDNISALVTERRSLRLNLVSGVDHYFSFCETLARIKKQIESTELFELRYESLVESPETRLRELCHFLGVDASDDYLANCASIMFKSPRKSRYETEWSRGLIDVVRQKIDRFSFLQGYSYES